jgi:hypothetical protein
MAWCLLGARLGLVLGGRLDILGRVAQVQTPVMALMCHIEGSM